jgi:hypothetical protein
MNKIIALAVKFSGFGWIWEKINGLKTKIAAISLMLSGAGVMLAGITELLNAWAACLDMACIIGLLRGITTNPHIVTVSTGFVTFSAGLGMLGIGHKMDKAAVIATDTKNAIATVADNGMMVGPMPELCKPDEPPKP